MGCRVGSRRKTVHDKVVDMKRLLCTAGCLLGILGFADETVVSVNIDSVKQRYPWNGKVDVDFTLRSTDPAA